MSLFVMDTVVVATAPRDTRMGRVPRVILTDSPSSSMSSGFAVKTKLFCVSPASNVRSAGTTE